MKRVTLTQQFWEDPVGAGRGGGGRQETTLSWDCSLPLKGGAGHKVAAAAASVTHQGEASQGCLWGWTAD